MLNDEPRKGRSSEVWRKTAGESEFRVSAGVSQCRGLRAKAHVSCGYCVLASGQRTLGVRRLAEGVGFEPTIRFPVYTLSRRAPSTTRPPLRKLPTSPSRKSRQEMTSIATASGSFSLPPTRRCITSEAAAESPPRPPLHHLRGRRCIPSEAAAASCIGSPNNSFRSSAMGKGTAGSFGYAPFHSIPSV